MKPDLSQKPPHPVPQPLNSLPCIWTHKRTHRYSITNVKAHAKGHRVSNPLHVKIMSFPSTLEGLLPSCSSSRLHTHFFHSFPFPHFTRLPFLPHHLLFWIFPVPSVVADPRWQKYLSSIIKAAGADGEIWRCDVINMVCYKKKRDITNSKQTTQSVSSARFTLMTCMFLAWAFIKNNFLSLFFD